MQREMNFPPCHRYQSKRNIILPSREFSCFQGQDLGKSQCLGRLRQQFREFSLPKLSKSQIFSVELFLKVMFMPELN